MIKKVLLFGTIALAVSPAQAAQQSRSYECIFDAPMGTKLEKGTFVSKPVTFRDKVSVWRYTFTLIPTTSGKATTLSVKSEKDFATIQGKYEAVSIAPNMYVSTAIKSGDCMFSDEICGAFIQLTDLDTENAAASITPISYFGDQKKGAQFFHVDMVGTCKAAAKSEVAK